MTHTPESLSKLTDDELRLEVARKMWPDAPEVGIDDGVIYGLDEDEDGCYGFVNPLSPEGAFRLMVENRLYPTERMGRGVVFVKVHFDTYTTSINDHTSTLEGTARAICEAYVLMKQEE